MATGANDSSTATTGSIQRFIGAAFALNERSLFTRFQKPLGIQQAVKLDEFGHEPGPAGLVTGAQRGPVVAVEVFVEQDVVAPVGSVWNFSLPVLIAEKGLVRRSEISWLTSKRFISFPKPVGGLSR